MAKKLKMDLIFWLTILSGIITVSLSAVTYYNGKKKEKAADELNIKLFERTEEVATLTHKISNLNEFIASTITGGETYPYIQIGFASTPRGLVLFSLISEGDNPLYDVALNIIDNDEAKRIMSTMANPGEADYRLWIKSFKIGNFRPNEVQEILTLMMGNNDSERNFTVELIARNGFFKQQIKIIKKGNSFKSESEIRKGDKILKKF